MRRPLLKNTTTTRPATLVSRIYGLLRDTFMALAIRGLRHRHLRSAVG